MSYCGTHRANSQPFGDWEAEENGTDKGKGKADRQSLVRMQPLAWKKKRFLCNHISHVPVTLTLSTFSPWIRAHLETIVCKFGRNPRSRSDLRKKFTDRRRTPRQCIIRQVHLHFKSQSTLPTTVVWIGLNAPTCSSTFRLVDASQSGYGLHVSRLLVCRKERNLIRPNKQTVDWFCRPVYRRLWTSSQQKTLSALYCCQRHNAI